jgi:hypothetical protein
MAIQQTINNYLSAVEKKFGPEARQQTRLQHRGGTTFVLKPAHAKHARVVDLGRLSQMARHLHASA